MQTGKSDQSQAEGKALFHNMSGVGSNSLNTSESFSPEHRRLPATFTCCGILIRGNQDKEFRRNEIKKFRRFTSMCLSLIKYRIIVYFFFTKNWGQ